MSAGRRSTFALVIAGAEIALFASGQILGFFARHDLTTSYWSSFAIAPMLAFPLFGGLLASRRPSNPIGWICLGSGGFWFYLFFAEAYATFALKTHPGSLPAPALVGAFANWVPAVGLLGTFLLLLFPDGRLLSRRWRPIAWLSAVSIVLVSVLVTVVPDSTSTSSVPAPFALHGTALAVAQKLGFVFFLFFASIVASVVSLVLRYRRSRAELREQMKWIVFAGIGFAAWYGVTIAASMLFDHPASSLQPVASALQSSIVGAFALMPTASFFAVLRYRLYDIDRIISRTLSYSLVTVFLAGTFALIVLLPTAVVGSASETPGWLIAAATLAAFGLFRPVRSRVQGSIDRRFNRSRYDALRTIETFAARLREQVDLDSLQDEICALVRTTMQPTGVSLWIRDRAAL